MRLTAAAAICATHYIAIYAIYMYIMCMRLIVKLEAILAVKLSSRQMYFITTRANAGRVSGCSVPRVSVFLSLSLCSLPSLCAMYSPKRRIHLYRYTIYICVTRSLLYAPSSPSIRMLWRKGGSRLAYSSTFVPFHSCSGYNCAHLRGIETDVCAQMQ